MNSTRILWRTAGTVALLATLLFIFGFVYGIQAILYPKPSELTLQKPAAKLPSSAALEGDKVQILALGDSLTKGTGDASGKGYVVRVKDSLAADLKKPVFVWNYGVVGAKTNDLLSQLTAAGSPIPDFVKQANVIVFTIGGNDIFQSGVTGSVLNSNNELNIDYANLAKKMPESLDRLDKIITSLAQANPKAHIVYVMFYHPFLDVDPQKSGSLLVQDWYSKAFAIANKFKNVTVVPTYDLFETNLLKYLYSDHFHPNQEGYARIADRVIQALE